MFWVYYLHIIHTRVLRIDLNFCAQLEMKVILYIKNCNNCILINQININMFVIENIYL